MKKKITFLLLMIFAATNIYSQNFTITFDASGAATTLDSVKIINLTHPDTAMWHDGDIFQLQLNNAINDLEANKENLHIFPNPMQGQADILFNVKQSGIASINIYEITGKEIIHSDENLSQGNHQFQLSGLKQGAYFINIKGNGYFYSSKLISYNSFSNDINLKYNGVIQETLINKYKTSNSSINFNFVSGDILQYTGYAANLTAVVTNSPISDITVTFNFIASLPSVTTYAASSITFYSALSAGNVTSDGGEIVTARGICYATTANPTIANNIVSGGSGTGFFTSNLTGLTPGTTYYVRAYATNSAGTAYGNELSFTTIPASLPVLTTTNASLITNATAITGGNISSDGGAFISARGVCWSIVPNPHIGLNTKTINGIGIGSFTSNISGLAAGTTYYVRAYATNSIGTAYGNEESFTTTTSLFPAVDIDGNGYDTIHIGSQVWMKQNLKTTKYNNGTAIPNLTDSATWGGLSTGARCYYNNDSVTYANTYGALYNWYTVNIGNLCPTGWHVPSDSEWTTLTTYLGGGNIAGGKLKETGFAHWNSPNSAATNETGFSAIPGGIRYSIGLFSAIGYCGFWWSSTESSTANARGMSVYYSNSSASIGNNSKAGGFSVRCIQGISPQTSLPTISTTPISGITVVTAISGGNISSDGNANITARGVCWSISANPTVALSTTTNDGTGIGSFTSNITGLSAGTTYYVRAYATNSMGTAYGNEVIFTTIPASLPILTTTNISLITSNTAISGGNITSDGGASVTAHGVCWSTVPNPHIGLNTKTINGIGIGSFTSNINGLTLGTTYYVRAYATNSLGTAYGNELSFTTLIPPIGTVIDYDGNVYDTVHIGTQVWLKQNLKTTHYKNGAAITYPGTNNAAWQNNTSGAYAWYNNDSASNKITYGALYNWYAVNTGNLCPTGWHVPSDDEWTTLTTYLGGDSIAGGKLKATTLWYSPNFGATNSSGFTALPGGARESSTYFDKGIYGDWWSSTEFIGPYAWYRLMSYDYSSVTRTYSFPKSFGFSVRCLKN